jgi:hypothetical protein
MSPDEREAKQQEQATQQPGGRPPSDPDQLREEIEETRQELGDTVEALAGKADVKAQAQAKVAQTEEQVRAAPQQAKARLGDLGHQAKERPAPAGAIAGAVLAAMVLLWLIRRR